MLRFARALLVAAAALVAVSCSGSTTTTTGGIARAGAVCATDGEQAKATDGCNFCRCQAGSWTCTQLDCTAQCSDGQRRDDGCNVCVCDSGRWSCTSATCGDATCTDGASKKAGDGCNTCSCSGGQWACTQRACATPCTDGDTTNDGCNSCACSGGQWVCTDVACPPSECTNGDTMSDGCNSCTCSGGQWACTRAACPPQECVDGDVMNDPCQTCTCSGGQWLCSAIPCVDPICPTPATPPPGGLCTANVVYARDPASGICCEYGNPCVAPSGWDQFGSQAECDMSGSCVPGETMPSPDGCNTCTCGPGGLWACTARACIGCLPGQTQRAQDGCNVCTCTDTGTWDCTADPCTIPVGCGGFLGATCTDDEYCAYQEGQLCGAADASATCAPRPSACDAVSQPVCGCDGQSYDNDCLAAMAGTGVSSSGLCVVAF